MDPLPAKLTDFQGRLLVGHQNIGRRNNPGFHGYPTGRADPYRRNRIS
jgi:hypothetical protein